MGKSFDFLVENIESLLEQKKWSRSELAEKAGVPQPQVSNWLNQKTEPGLDVIDAIAVSLGVPSWELFRDPSAAENVARLNEALIHVKAAQDALTRLTNAKSLPKPPKKSR